MVVRVRLPPVALFFTTVNFTVMKNEKRFSVWVGGVEVNDYLLTKKEAEKLARSWRNKGYDDVSIDEY